MEARSPALQREIYTLCLRLTAQQTLARQLALSALCDANPHQKAVELCLREMLQVSGEENKGACGMDASLFKLPPRLRLASVLLDIFALPIEDVSRWTHIPKSSLRNDQYLSRKKLAEMVNL